MYYNLYLPLAISANINAGASILMWNAQISVIFDFISSDRIQQSLPGNTTTRKRPSLQCCMISQQA
jgi:hypothetical protein